MERTTHVGVVATLSVNVSGTWCMPVDMVHGAWWHPVTLTMTGDF